MRTFTVAFLVAASAVAQEPAPENRCGAGFGVNPQGCTFSFEKSGLSLDSEVKLTIIATSATVPYQLGVVSKTSDGKKVLGTFARVTRTLPASDPDKKPLIIKQEDGSLPASWIVYPGESLVLEVVSATWNDVKGDYVPDTVSKKTDLSVSLEALAQYQEFLRMVTPPVVIQKDLGTGEIASYTREMPPPASTTEPKK